MSGLRVVVDTTSPVPAYEQLRRQVATLVSTGVLLAGDRLPAARALAADLGLALGTVQRAYRELEAAGVVESRRRTGTVITANPVVVDEEVRWAAEGYVERALQAGLAHEEVLDLVRDALLRASSRRAPVR
ncbi:GntR family transcriptional regulator [Kineococcus esterisolvens]|uniref:GntR family transcriptional regulator n=1 Tax=unclassified Kineococcus TaxID=2621656 RepID=UPI003D7D9867